MEWLTLPGLVNYERGLQIMEDRLAGVIARTLPEAIYLLEHADVYTAGTSAVTDELVDHGGRIPVFYTGRGGKFTYHGPGQRVIYPVLRLNQKPWYQDIKQYIRTLETWVINTLAQVSVQAYRIDGMIGIWVNFQHRPAKIAAIGVRVKKWVAYHGIAVNISTNLSRYSGIIPCGISRFPVTSLHELGIAISMKDFDCLLMTELRKLMTDENY